MSDERRKRMEDLQRQTNALNAVWRALRDEVDAEEAQRLVGKCFAYSNPGDGSQSYVFVQSRDVRFLNCVYFQLEERGGISVESRVYAADFLSTPPRPVHSMFSSLIEITPDELLAAWAKMADHFGKFGEQIAEAGR